MKDKFNNRMTFENLRDSIICNSANLKQLDEERARMDANEEEDRHDGELFLSWIVWYGDEISVRVGDWDGDVIAVVYDKLFSFNRELAKTDVNAPNPLYVSYMKREMVVSHHEFKIDGLQ